MSDKIRKYIIPYLPYAFIAVLFGNLGEAFRLAQGADIGQKLTAALGMIAPAFANILPGYHPFDWLVGITGAALLRLYIYQKSKKAKKYRKDVEYGSARWSA